jgi:hypothetical protein
LRAAAIANAERLASRAIGAVLDPAADSLRAGKLALELIDAADPRNQAELTLSTPVDPEVVHSMSLSELLSYAQANGIPYGAVDSSTGAVDDTSGAA